jgi:eukaryotic-like serine/threonine-protein kinase
MTGDSAKVADDISHDGKFLLYEETGTGRKTTRSDVLLLALGGADKPVPILQSEFNESHAQLSVDGRWLAYVSDESGRDEVYVQPFASDGKPAAAKWQISTSGGRDPRWRRDGSELYYLAADQKLMMVPVKASAGAAFSVASPQPLFEMPPLSATLRQGEFRYAVSSDGKRFLVYSSAMEGAQPPIIAVTNWQAGLKK